MPMDRWYKYGMSNVYLDYAATTPLDKRVLDTMMPYFNKEFGNPSSIHFHGQHAEAAMEDARQNAANLFGVKSREIIFTSGGTESDNLAVRGSAMAQKEKYGKRHLLTTPVEHHAVSQTMEQLARVYGFELEYLPVDEFGMVNASDIGSKIRKNTALVSVIFAQNEVGTVNPIREIGQICRQKNVPFHTDAVQAAAHFCLDINSEYIDLLSIGAHKFYGPKGIGALFIREGSDILPCQTGGGQEEHLRAGTQNIPSIVGLAEALKLVYKEGKSRNERLIPLRDLVITEILGKIPDSRLTGHPTQRLPNHASFVFDKVNGNNLLMLLDNAGFSCSSGSACKVGNARPSEVLIAMGIKPSWALGSLRVTLGESSCEENVSSFLQVLPVMVEKARKM
jgi:cysteine desulfurase